MSSITQNKNLLIGVVAVAAILILGLVFLNPSGPQGSGTVLVYGSVDAEDMQPVIDAFHSSHPDITLHLKYILEYKPRSKLELKLLI